MGLLFSTRGTRRIVVALNKAFNRKNLATIRADEASKPFFTDPGRNWKLRKLARVYQLYPWDPDNAGNTGGFDPVERKRWHYFLTKVLKDPQHDIIRDSLRQAIGDFQFYRISFDHVHVKKSRDQEVVIFDKVFTGGEKLRHITLFTRKVDKNEEVGYPDFDVIDLDEKPYPNQEDDGGE